MASPDSRVAQVAQSLAEISALCDRGFALAVHIRLTRPTLLYQSYSSAWTEHYSLKGYMLTDPVVRWGIGNCGWIRWSDLTSMDPAGVIPGAISFGLTNGWTYSTGPASSRTISGTTKSGPDFTDAEREAIRAHINAIHEVTENFDSFPPEVQQALRDLDPTG